MQSVGRMKGPYSIYTMVLLAESRRDGIHKIIWDVCILPNMHVPQNYTEKT